MISDLSIKTLNAAIWNCLKCKRVRNKTKVPFSMLVCTNVHSAEDLILDYTQIAYIGKISDTL